METSVILRNLANFITPAGSYSANANAFLTNGYVSAANNVYFNAVRFAEGLLIKEDIGQGYARTFLNGIQIFSLRDGVLLSDRRFDCYFYSKEAVLHQSKLMLLDLLKKATVNQGLTIDYAEAELAIFKMLRDSFERNQVEMAHKQAHYLNS
ncbi:MAG: hypothetical protein IPH20_13625 [Bacteroidales bacterium]|nr:hypothetical protein [Bacteroidales bacterium]